MIPSSSILRTLDLAQQGLMAQQTALDTIGQNIANVSTPGYTRQRADLVPVSPRGVQVQDIQRLRDRFLDISLLNEQQALGKGQAEQGLLQRLEDVFNDPSSTGLGPQIDQFFNAFHDLSANPTDQAVRVTVRDQGVQLAGTLQQTRASVVQIEDDATTQIQQRVASANELIAQIADLNRQIVAARSGPNPNALLDQRDTLVGTLNQIIGVSTTDLANGGVQLAVTGTGVLIVDGLETAPLTATTDAATDTVNLTAGTTAIPITPKSGALGGLVNARNNPSGPLKQALGDLDALAQTIITDVNRVHASGTGLTEPDSVVATNAVSGAAVALGSAGLPTAPKAGVLNVYVHDASGAVSSSVSVTIDPTTTTLTSLATALGADSDLTVGVTGGKLAITAAAGKTLVFTDTSDTLLGFGIGGFFTGTDAATIAVDPAIAADPGRIAAAQADATGLVHPGDGSNALAIAQLAGATGMSGGTATYSTFYGALVGTVGSQAKTANDDVTREQSAVELVQNLQQQTSGVSTDEELVNLSQAQTAYAAAARIATTVNDMIQTLLAMATT